MKKVMGLIAANYSPDLLGDLTIERPLAAMPFGGRYRLLDFALSNMVNMGIHTVGIITPSHYRPIMDHLGAGKEWSLDRKRGGLFILPGLNYGYRNMATKFLLRDIMNNMEYLIRADEEHVIISSANQVFNISFEAMAKAHIAADADVTLLYKQTTGFYESPEEKIFLNLGDAGRVDSMSHSQAAVKENLFCDVIIIKRKLLMQFIEWYREVPYIDLMEVIEHNIRTVNVRSYEMTGYSHRIDSVENYFQTSMDLLKKEVREELFTGERKIYTKVRDNVPTRYETGCKVRNSLIANGCTIQGQIENSVLSRRCVVKPGAVVKNCIIMQGAVINSGAVLENAIIDKYTEISADTVIKGRAEKPIYLRKMATI